MFTEKQAATIDAILRGLRAEGHRAFSTVDGGTQLIEVGAGSGLTLIYITARGRLGMRIWCEVTAPRWGWAGWLEVRNPDASAAVVLDKVPPASLLTN